MLQWEWMYKSKKWSGDHAIIHTVHVLLTSQAVRSVPACKGQADHHQSHDKHHDSRQDGHQYFWFKPGLHPGREFLVNIRVARQRRDGTYNKLPLWWSLAPRTTQTTTIAMIMTRIEATTGTIRLRCDRMILIVCSGLSDPPPSSRAGAIVPEMQAR